MVFKKLLFFLRKDVLENARLRNRIGRGSGKTRNADEIRRLLARIYVYGNARDFRSDVNSRIPEFYEIVDILAFIRVIRKSRSLLPIDSMARIRAWITLKTCLFFPFSLFFFLNCPTIGISSARTNNYLIACLNYAFCHEDRYRGNWTWKLFGKKGKRGVNLERIKFTRARKKEGDEKIK